MHAPPAFTRIRAFAFYDGPETGLAKTAAGDIYRFEEVGESRHRRYRAYLLERVLEDALTRETDPDVAFDWITASEWERVRHAPSGERYVGISDLWLRGLVVNRMEPEAPSPSDFAEAHALLRSKFFSAGQPG